MAASTAATGCFEIGGLRLGARIWGSNSPGGFIVGLGPLQRDFGLLDCVVIHPCFFLRGRLEMTIVFAIPAGHSLSLVAVGPGDSLGLFCLLMSQCFFPNVGQSSTFPCRLDGVD